MKIYSSIVLVLAAVLLAACGSTAEMERVSVPLPENVTLNVLTGETFDMAYLNKAVRPQDDFFEFANGTWIKENPVPASESRWGSFNELDQANKDKLTKILDAAMSMDTAEGSRDHILGNYYGSYTNMTQRNSLGLNPISVDMAAVAKINSKKDILNVIASHHTVGISTLFRFGVRQDLKDIDNHISSFGQGGIGLPNKEYYLTDSKKEILDKYEAHIAKMMLLCGFDGKKSKAISASVIAFETRLAKASMAPAEMRIPENTYNKMALQPMLDKAKNFDFESYLSATGSQSFDSLVVGQPLFWNEIVTMLDDTPLDAWKDYMTWKVVNNYADHLNEEFVAENFNFYGVVLRGKKEMKPLNERAIEEITNSAFSELLGKAFVEEHFSQEAQDRVNTMVDNLLIVFRGRINNLEWMSQTTKKEALKKLNSIGRKLGFPSKWEDFSSIVFDKENYTENVKIISRFAHHRNMAKLNNPVDKEEWGMPAHMVNAYYHPLLNEIAFPAGIMQAPFFSDTYEDAVNYGRIGMVIGHEFTHGFDDMGSKFAADGSFKNWWTASDRTLFEEKTSKLGATYDGFCPIDGHCVNSSLTMGENIADLGGLTLAYNAFKRTDEFKSGEMKHGYTPGQRFFIAYAQLWKINYTDEELKNRIANDPHSPGMYRVNGPLMNCPDFFNEFNVLEGDAMRNSADKISNIW
ncbi:MAG: putative endopeptidase [Flavobacteriaceae bacterium]|jgi:putative endopeptidase